MSRQCDYIYSPSMSEPPDTKPRSAVISDGLHHFFPASTSANPYGTSGSIFANPLSNYRYTNSVNSTQMTTYDQFPSSYDEMTSLSTPVSFSFQVSPSELPRTFPNASFPPPQRSSMSTAPECGSFYASSDAFAMLATPVKVEEHSVWSSPPDKLAIVHEPSLCQSQLTPFPSFVDANPLNDAFNQLLDTPIPKRTALSLSPSHNLATTAPSQTPERRLRSSSTRSTRGIRKMTTREDANFQCGVEGCGKLFSRSYNYKAHMATHDTGRVYAFPCTVRGCDKKFVRRTDLQRHHQSVHLKERAHSCDYCGRQFSRKDTLRRHMEDGCNKRFDISILGPPSALGQTEPVGFTDSTSYLQPALTPYSMEYSLSPRTVSSLPPSGLPPGLDYTTDPTASGSPFYGPIMGQ